MIVYQWYAILFYIVTALLFSDVIYLIFCLFMSNSLFHILMLFMVSIIQIPQLAIFPRKEKRYEGAQQELLFNGKSK